MKAWKALLICLMLSALCCIHAYAASNRDNSRLCFGNIKYSQNGANVTVSGDVSNNQSVTKNAMLMVASYDDDGRMYNLRINKQSVGAGETRLLQIENYSPVAGLTVKAFIMGDLFHNGQTGMPANMGSASAELAYILVNGEPIKDFSGDTYSYLVKKTGDLEIEAAAKDGTASVTIRKEAELRVYHITVTASNGTENEYTVSAYDNVRDTTALSKIIYKADNETEAHTVDYKSVIELPENAKTVEIEAVSDYSKDVSYYVVNSAISGPTDDVSYGSMGAQSRVAFTYERPAVNNTIPIKNEESKAIIKVTGLGENGKEEVKEYTITFKAKQPRLISFESENKTYYPVFVSGAAVWDDNGSTSASDRNYIIKGMSESLLGGSAFLFPVNNKESGTWWNDSTSGTYFTFSADTPGTVYVLSQSTINNSEYTEDKNNKKWKSADVLTYKFEYADNDTRVNHPETILIPPANNDERDPNQSYAAAMKSAYSKKFRAGEVVSIYHTGNNSSVNDPKVMAVVVWNEETETIASLESISSKLDGEKPLLEQIPGEITATTAEGEKLLAEVQWDLDSFDKNKVGLQNVSGTLKVPEGYVLKEGLSPEVTAKVVVLQDSDYLSGLSYKVGGKAIAVPDFDPKTLSYTVELPAYTNSVEICAEGSGTVETYVQNDQIAISGDKVTYGKMGALAVNAFTGERPAKDNVIPIKNEESTAVIKVKNTLDGMEYEMEYKVVFKSRQVRLTSFQCVEDKAILTPVFVSGAAVWDDGRYNEEAGIPAQGSVVASDRGQIISSVPDDLRGASSILFPQSNKESGSTSDPETSNWWNKHNSGTYFSFAAEQGGTIYIFAQNGFKNAEYTEDSHGDGWVKADCSVSVVNVGSTWNKVYARSFEKGETVHVYHSGIGGTTSTNDYKITGMIVWDSTVIRAIDPCEDINVDAAKDITEQLPATVTVTMSNGKKLPADVLWNLKDYDNAYGEHIIYGRIRDEFLEENGFTFAEDAENETAITVHVMENKLASVAEIAPIKVLVGEDILEKLPQTVQATTLFGETLVCGIEWDAESGVTDTAGLKEITGTITPPAGVSADSDTITAQAIVRYDDENLVLALESEGFDTEHNKWFDLSRYGTDINIPKDSENIAWDEDGLSTAAGVDDLLEIPLTDELKDALMAKSFAIEFELYDIVKQENGEMPLLTADILYEKDGATLSGKLIINYNDNKKRSDFKFGGNLTKYWSVDDIGSILSPHVIRYEVGNGKVSMLLDGSSTEKTLTNVTVKDITKLTFTGNSKITNSNTIGGSATWKALRIYKIAE